MTNEPVSPLSTPLFSVVISTYNYGHLVERAIDSVLKQDFDRYELIVVDDGSTDDTEERLKRFAGRLHYIKKNNGGQSSALNVGAQAARGSYIYVLDADDEMMPSSLRTFADAISSAKERNSIFYGGYISVSETGEERERKSTDTPQSPRPALTAFLTKKTTGLKNGAFVIPSAAFSKIKYPEGLHNNTDIVFIGQALTMYRALNIQATVLKSHEHPQRTRKQLDRILNAGIRPVEALFDPGVVPPELMPLRRLHLALRWRSLARLLYTHGRYKEADQAYRSAFKAAPRTVLDWGSLRRAGVSWLKGRS
jgi:glycosyltransferase involved in cell wall biosynthesis